MYLLLALKDILGRLHVRDVQRMVDAAWEPVEGQMRIEEVTHDDIVTSERNNTRVMRRDRC